MNTVILLLPVLAPGCAARHRCRHRLGPDDVGRHGAGRDRRAGVRQRAVHPSRRTVPRSRPAALLRADALTAIMMLCHRGRRRRCPPGPASGISKPNSSAVKRPRAAPGCTACWSTSSSRAWRSPSSPTTSASVWVAIEATTVAHRLPGRPSPHPHSVGSDLEVRAHLLGRHRHGLPRHRVAVLRRPARRFHGGNALALDALAAHAAPPGSRGDAARCRAAAARLRNQGGAGAVPHLAG